MPWKLRESRRLVNGLYKPAVCAEDRLGAEEPENQAKNVSRFLHELSRSPQFLTFDAQEGLIFRCGTSPQPSFSVCRNRKDESVCERRAARTLRVPALLLRPCCRRGGFFASVE